MKAKHTPKPWEIKYNGPDEEYWVTTPHYDAGPARIICNIADARLIAAAPELLEALVICESKIASLLWFAHPKVYEVWLDVVRAAIDKATGEKA
jgi:hypothetical protein